MTHIIIFSNTILKIFNNCFIEKWNLEELIKLSNRNYIVYHDFENNSAWKELKKIVRKLIYSIHQTDTSFRLPRASLSKWIFKKSLSLFLIVSFSFQEKKNLKTNKTAPFNIRDSTRSKVDNDNVILNVKSEISTKIKVITT